MKQNKGFTLIELIIVVAILGILMAIAIPSYNGMTRNAKTAATRAFATQVNSFAYGEGVNARITTGTFKFPSKAYVTLDRITDTGGSGDAGTGEFIAQWSAVVDGAGEFVTFTYIPDPDYAVVYISKADFTEYGVAMSINATSPEALGASTVVWTAIGAQGEDFDTGGEIAAIIEA